MTEGINISPATLKQWAADEERLMKEIAVKQQELAIVQKNRAAAAVLEASMTPKTGKLAFDEQIAVKANGHSHESGQNMTLAIENIANRSAAPIAKKDLRRQLAEAGFASDSPYFYTVLMRLKKRKKIAVTVDGRISRAPG